MLNANPDVMSDGDELQMASSRLFRRQVQTFINEARGQVAVTFGLVLLPLTVAAGVAVDYSQAQKYQSELQVAADAAILAAGAQPDKSLSKLEAIADSYFESNINLNSRVEIGLTQLQQSGNTLTYNVTASVDTVLLKVAGIEAIDLHATSEVTPSLHATELVIVMDTTGSMSFGSSWTDAKNVINQTVETLSSLQSTNDGFYVTLLPISDRVNVGTNKSAWLSVAAPASWNGCMAPREEPTADFPYALTDKPPSQLAFLPSAIGYDDVYSNSNASWVDHGTNGNPHDDNLPVCPVGITGPTNDPADIQAALDALTPQGTGRFDEAMVWAWRLLSPDWSGLWGEVDYPRPFAERRKIVAFISDGLTEAYRHEVGGDGDGVSPPNVIFGWNKGSKWGFEHLVEVCEQMKFDGIEIHMIKVNGNPNAQQYFRDCASSNEYFYEVVDADDFQDAVATIETRVTALRLTR